MKTRLLITIGIIVGIGIAYVIYSEIPKYGATVITPSKFTLECSHTVKHGFFSEYPVLEELILNHINDPKSRLALEIPFYEIDSYRNFMIENFGEPSPDCFVYQYQDKQYDVKSTIGPKSYFTHSVFP
jgi:hypothetical protein